MVTVAGWGVVPTKRFLKFETTTFLRLFQIQQLFDTVHGRNPGSWLIWRIRFSYKFCLELQEFWTINRMDGSKNNIPKGPLWRNIVFFAKSFTFSIKTLLNSEGQRSFLGTSKTCYGQIPEINTLQLGITVFYEISVIPKIRMMSFRLNLSQIGSFKKLTNKAKTALSHTHTHTKNSLRLPLWAFLNKLTPNIQLMLNWWFGFLGSPYERDCYLGVSLESQTINH